jgi:hypothetical protein
MDMKTLLALLGATLLACSPAAESSSSAESSSFAASSSLAAMLVGAGTADKHRGEHEEHEQKATVTLQGGNPLSTDQMAGVS